MSISFRYASLLTKEAQRHSQHLNLPACCLGRFSCWQFPKFSFYTDLKTVLAK